MGLRKAAVAQKLFSRSELLIPFLKALVMGFPIRYDTSPLANKRQFSPTFTQLIQREGQSQKFVLTADCKKLIHCSHKNSAQASFCLVQNDLTLLL